MHVKSMVKCAGKNLQAQYERWQPRAKYKMHLDPTVDDVKKLAQSCRRTAKVGLPPCVTRINRTRVVRNASWLTDVELVAATERESVVSL